MKYFRPLVPVLALVLIGGGCAATNRVPPPVPPVPPVPVAVEESALKEGEFRTKKGHLDRIRNIRFVGSVDGKITSPLVITGEARLWYFEAVFPVAILDEYGNDIVRGQASADEDWMTEDWVPFSAELPFPPQPAGSKGRVILRADNPSGLPEGDDHVGIPVIF